MEFPIYRSKRERYCDSEIEIIREAVYEKRYKWSDFILIKWRIAGSQWYRVRSNNRQERIAGYRRVVETTDGFAEEFLPIEGDISRYAD